MAPSPRREPSRKTPVRKPCPYSSTPTGIMLRNRNPPGGARFILDKRPLRRFFTTEGLFMNPFRAGLPLLVFLLPVAVFSADSTERKSPKEALKAFNDLVGSWRGT